MNVLAHETQVVQPTFSPMELDSKEQHEPIFGKGKGKGRGKGKGKGKGGKGENFGGRGKGKGGERSQQPPQFRARIVCKYCSKIGHYEANCFARKRNEEKERKLKEASPTSKDEPNKKASSREFLALKVMCNVFSLAFLSKEVRE